MSEGHCAMEAECGAMPFGYCALRLLGYDPTMLPGSPGMAISPG